jgi:hypothetical protein
MKDMMQLKEKETPNWETAMKTIPFSGSRTGGTACDVDGSSGFMSAATLPWRDHGTGWGLRINCIGRQD